MDKITALMMAEKLGLNLHEVRLGYHLGNNPNKLMPDGVKSITIHQTGNTDVGADAERHHSYLRNGSGGGKVSWHYTVDEQEAIQSFRDNRVTWHSATKTGNETSIGIEMCIDADRVGENVMGSKNYKKTIENTQKLVAIKLHEHGLKVTDIKQHFDWSKKNCPRQLREGLHGVTWGQFLEGVKAQYKALDAILNPKKVTQTPAPDGKLFMVKFGAFKYRENALQLIKEAEEKGFSAYMTIDDDPNYGK